MRTVLAGCDRSPQRDERYGSQRDGILESSDAFQRQRPLHFSVRYQRTGWRSRQTRYRELAQFGGPIIIEKLLNADLFGSLDLLRPR